MFLGDTYSHFSLLFYTFFLILKLFILKSFQIYKNVAEIIQKVSEYFTQ